MFRQLTWQLSECSTQTYSQNVEWIKSIVVCVIVIHILFYFVVNYLGESDILVLRLINIAILCPYLFLRNKEQTFPGKILVRLFVPILCLAGPVFLIPAILIEGAQALPDPEVVIRRQYELLGSLGLFIAFCSYRIIAFLIWLTQSIAISAIMIVTYQVDTGFVTQNLPFVTSFWLFIFATIALLTLRDREKKSTQKQSIKRVGESVAHELRTPLVNIRNRMEALEKFAPSIFRGEIPGYSGNRFRDRLLKETPEKIVDEVNAALTLIDILLVKARDIKANPVTPEFFDVQEVISEVIERYPFRSPLERSYLDVSSLQSCTLFGPRLLFTHVILNLLKNALYYAASSKSSPYVQISAEVNADGFCFEIVDTGPGIPSDAILNIFEHSYSGSPLEGTGVGLSFCKECVELGFDGRITCISDGETFTKFKVVIPNTQIASQ